MCTMLIVERIFWSYSGSFGNKRTCWQEAIEHKNSLDWKKFYLFKFSYI